MYIYIYIYMYVYMHAMYICIYMYIYIYLLNKCTEYIKKCVYVCTYSVSSRGFLVVSRNLWPCKADYGVLGMYRCTCLALMYIHIYIISVYIYIYRV